MARTHRKKDVLAAVVIIGTALIYWMNRRSPEITFDSRESEQAQPTMGSDERVTTLPGLRRSE